MKIYIVNAQNEKKKEIWEKIRRCRMEDIGEGKKRENSKWQMENQFKLVNSFSL